MIAQFY